MTTGHDRARDDTRARLLDARTLAIIRYTGGGDVLGVVRTVVDGGLGAVEVTTNTPGWRHVVHAAVEQHPHATVGVGTVTDAEQVRVASDLGARFVVSPGFDAAVVGRAHALGLEALPGVTTPTEVLAARAAGVRLFKLFPAGALGLPYLEQLRGPFPEADFVVTGGIGLDDAAEWRARGASIVSLGSALTGSSVPDGPDGWSALRQRIATASDRDDRGPRRSGIATAADRDGTQ